MDTSPSKRACLVLITALAVTQALAGERPGAAAADEGVLETTNHPAEVTVPSNARKPKNDADLEYWLRNMVGYHNFTVSEVREATGLSEQEITEALKKWNIKPGTRRLDAAECPLIVLPYPGGRHPRIGFLEGAIDPQRETKFSVFTPWDPNSYVVVDVPEAIWSNLGLTYLAHTHVETIWTKQNVKMQPLEWTRGPNLRLDITRKLPNGIEFSVRVVPKKQAVLMELRLKNGTDEPLSNLQVQNCVMTSMAAGFEQQTNENKILTNPYAACSDKFRRRWIITAWTYCIKPWANPQCPCFHSDPKFPDLKPGQEHTLRGWLSFYEGTDIHAEIKRIDATDWQTMPLDGQIKVKVPTYEPLSRRRPR